jgi:glycosyltransferase involved in cell wall biosynthesis
MRVVHLYKDFDPPVVGGIERMIRWTATRTARRDGVHVTVLAAAPADPALAEGLLERETIEGVDVIRLPALARPGGAPLVPAWTRTLRELKPDIVHLHHPCPTCDLALWSLPKRERPPFVVTWHSDVVRQRLAYRAYQPLQRWTLRNAALVMPTSERYLASSAQLAPARKRPGACKVVPLGIDFDEAVPPPDEARIAAWREKLGPNPVALFVGVLRYYKGLNFLIDAWGKLKLDATLVIAGAGPLRAELEAQAASLPDGKGASIHFAGRVDDGDAAALRAVASAFVMPSHLRAEAFGLSQVEAMAAGLPVISCDLATGVPEVNRDRVTGIVVPPGNAAAIVNALDELLRYNNPRDRMGRAAKERARSLYDADRMEAAIFQAYESAADRRGA